MDKGKRIESTNSEFQLPEAIIQHIQSFLTGKQAAQTSILSKSWYSAWSTRPNLDLDQREYRRNHVHSYENQIPKFLSEFSVFAKKTMQRYEDLNLKIESFRLSMEDLWIRIPENYTLSLAKELTVKAMKMGATDLSFKLKYRSSKFVLPHEVLGSETLISLSLNGCEIDQVVNRKVHCSKLKSLILREVILEGGMIWDIILSCPLIEKLILSKCSCTIKFPDSNVTTVLPMSLPDIANLYEFHKLRCLLLENVHIDTLFFRDFSSKFPCLKDLTVRDCFGYKGIQISSRSLVCVNFAHQKMLRVKFDVPSIREFSFSGSCIPSLSFKSASREWESDISITCCRRPGTLWFLKLNKFLTKLSLSRISLSLSIWSGKSFDYTGDIQGLPKPVVENLMIDVPSKVCSALFDGLFQSCRPKFITQDWLPESSFGGKANHDFVEILCKRLMQQVSRNCCIPSQCMFGQSDLKEVNVEVFEENVAEWRPLPLKTLLDASTNPKTKQKIRFRLRWGLEPLTLR